MLGSGRDPLAVADEQHAAGELRLDRDRLVEGEHDPAVAAGPGAGLAALHADEPRGQRRSEPGQEGEQRQRRGQQPRATSSTDPGSPANRSHRLADPNPARGP
jgi:hypothetical protein